MIEITQTKLHDPENGVHGNCFIACVASIIEFPLKYIPAFEEMPDYYNGTGGWFSLVNNWLVLYGWELNMHKATKPPKGYSIISGKSPRNAGLHSCIALDGVLIYDPHPSRKGIEDTRDYITIDKL